VSGEASILQTKKGLTAFGGSAKPSQALLPLPPIIANEAIPLKTWIFSSL